MEGEQIQKEKILEELETNEMDIISIHLSMYLYSEVYTFF